MYHVSCQNRKWISSKCSMLLKFWQRQPLWNSSGDSERNPNSEKKVKYFSFIQAYKELGLHMTHNKHNTTRQWISIALQQHWAFLMTIVDFQNQKCLVAI